jgi:hypothetical protein
MISFTLLTTQWKVVLADRYDACLMGISEDKVTGTCNFCTKEIFIARGLTEEMTLSTIRQEITHAIVKQLMNGQDEFNQEDLAVFVSTYGQFIVQTSEEIYREIESEGK